jgi:cathepsin L
MKSTTLVALAGLLALVPAFYGGERMQTQDENALFEKFVIENRRSYFSREEYHFRLGVFKQNLQLIGELNAKNTFGPTFSINFFADQTEEEKQLVLGAPKNRAQSLRGERDDKVPVTAYPDEKKHVTLPTVKDWRNPQWPVKDQKSCGSCWTFSALGAVAGNCGLRTSKWLDLSEQELVDCVHDFECKGCNGGWMSYGMQYTKLKNGVALSSRYPYFARDGNC